MYKQIIKLGLIYLLTVKVNGVLLGQGNNNNAVDIHHTTKDNIYFVNTLYNSTCINDVLEINANLADYCESWGSSSTMYQCNSSIGVVETNFDDNGECSNQPNTTKVIPFHKCKYFGNNEFTQVSCMTEKEVLMETKGYTSIQYFDGDGCSGQMVKLAASPKPLCFIDYHYYIRCDRHWESNSTTSDTPLKSSLSIATCIDDFCLECQEFKQVDPFCLDGVYISCQD